MRRIVLSGLVLAGVAATAWAQAGADWGRQAEYAKDFAGSQAVCRRVEGRTIPRADGPDPKSAAALRGCDAEALYYGIGRPRDFVAARRCAITKLKVPNGEGEYAMFGGRGVLAMLYANGRGVRRDLDLAIHMTCGMTAAAVEHDNYVNNLMSMKGQAKPEAFDVCQDLTSGTGLGACAYHDLRVETARRDAVYARLGKGWTPAQRRAFEALKASASAYAKSHGVKETDTGGTIHWARMAATEGQRLSDFDRLVRQLGSGRLPAAPTGLAAADAGLNAAYRKAIAAPPPDTGIEAAGIRETERLWLAYRDAWTRFAALTYPKVPRGRLAAHLTDERTRVLERLGVDPDAPE